jgi:hypothetical protein
MVCAALSKTLRGKPMAKIRSIFFVAPLALMLAVPLAACDPPDSQQISDVVQQVQTGAQKACGFVPAVSTVTQIITAFTGGAAAAAAVTDTIQAICNAVAPPIAVSTNKSVRRRAAVANRVVIVNGRSISVQGKFVQ